VRIVATRAGEVKPAPRALTTPGWFVPPLAERDPADGRRRTVGEEEGRRAVAARRREAPPGLQPASRAP